MAQIEKVYNLKKQKNMNYFLDEQKNIANKVISENIEKLEDISVVLKKSKDKYSKNVLLENILLSIIIFCILLWCVLNPLLAIFLSLRFQTLSNMLPTMILIFYALAIYPVLYVIKEALEMPKIEEIDVYIKSLDRLKRRLNHMRKEVDDLAFRYNAMLNNNDRLSRFNVNVNVDNDILRLEKFAAHPVHETPGMLQKAITASYFTVTVCFGIIASLYGGYILALTDEGSVVSTIMIVAIVTFVILYILLHLIIFRTRKKINVLTYFISILFPLLAVLSIEYGEYTRLVIYAFLLFEVGRMIYVRVKND